MERETRDPCEESSCRESGCISDLMTRDPLTASPETPVAEVLQLMTARRIRHVPVCDDESLLLGIVSQRDILGISASGGPLEQLAVGEVMHASVDTAKPGCCVGSAARHMLGTKRSSLPVVDGKGRVVGILTEADFLRFVLRGSPACPCCGVTPVEGV